MSVKAYLKCSGHIQAGFATTTMTEGIKSSLYKPELEGSEQASQGE